MEKISPPQAAKLMGVGLPLLNQWLGKGLVPAAQDAPHQPRTLNRHGLLCIGVLKALRKQGASMYTINPIAKFLAGLSLAELETAIDEGCTVLVSAAPSLKPRLIPPSTAVLNDSGGMVVLAAIDIGACWRMLATRLDKATSEEIPA